MIIKKQNTPGTHYLTAQIGITEQDGRLPLANTASAPATTPYLRDNCTR